MNSNYSESGDNIEMKMISHKIKINNGDILMPIISGEEPLIDFFAEKVSYNNTIFEALDKTLVYAAGMEYIKDFDISNDEHREEAEKKYRENGISNRFTVGTLPRLMKMLLKNLGLEAIKDDLKNFYSDRFMEQSKNYIKHVTEENKAILENLCAQNMRERALYNTFIRGSDSFAPMDIFWSSIILRGHNIELKHIKK